MKTNFHFGLYVLLIIGMGIMGCNPTKKLLPNQYLLIKNKVEKTFVEKRAKNKDFISGILDIGYTQGDKIEYHITQKPNTKMLGLFKFHLAVYNMTSKRRAKKSLQEETEEEGSDIEKKIRKIVGEPPVILDTLETHKSSIQIQDFLINKGYFKSQVKDSIALKTRKKGGGKAKVYYKIDMGSRYSFNQLIYKIGDKEIEELVYSDSINSFIEPGLPYDIDQLENERSRITKILQNNGYYAFSKDQIYFEADSTIGNKKVDVTLKIKPNQKTNAPDSVQNTAHIRYYISKVYVHTQFDPNQYYITDTLEYKDYNFVRSIPHKRKPDRDQFIKFTTLTQKIFFTEGTQFSISDLENTYSHLGGLQLFKFINISFIQKQNGDSLDCIIQLTPVPKQYFSIETEGTHSEGNLGIGTNLVYNNKNTMKGAEILEIRFKGALEAQKTFAVSEDKEVSPIEVFNTIEAGPEIKYHIPRLLFPVKADKIPKRYDPKTVLSAAYNFQRRTDFTRSIANFSFAYEWKESEYKTHILAPLEISTIKIAPNSPILDTINSISNDFIRYSFIDHLTTATRYTFIFNNQQLAKKRNFTYFRGNVEFAGNTLRTINNLLESEKTGDGESYEIFGIQYAQFMRFDADIRQYAIINQHNTIVFRLAAGMGITYGNSTVLPFEKSYFAGGANGIRAWQARDLGPGSYNGPTNFDQIGDIKIEANIESRFDIVGVFEGAAFVDIGNIWLLNEDEERPGAQFQANQFVNELAMGGGLGLRLNFSFFIIRLDAAIPFKDPSRESTKRWVLENSSIEDINFNLGIGYPF